MSDMTRVDLSNLDADREPTAQELAEVPTMTQAEMLQVMRSQEYKSSKLVQRLIAASIAKSQPSKPEIDPAPWNTNGEIQSGDEIQAKHETAKAMFRDPRYKTSAAYRFEVHQKLAELTQNDGGLSTGDLSTPNQSVSIGLSSSPDKGADLTVRRFHRVELAPDITGEAPARKPKPEPFADWK